MCEELKYLLVFKFRTVDEDDPSAAAQEIEREEIVCCAPDRLRMKIVEEKSRLESIANQCFSASNPDGRVKVTLSHFTRI